MEEDLEATAEKPSQNTQKVKAFLEQIHSLQMMRQPLRMDDPQAQRMKESQSAGLI